MLLQAQKASPRKYSEDSRDFQLVEHLYDAAFNNSKTAIDAFDPASRVKLDNKLLTLACRTLGFENKGDYDAFVLVKLIEVFKSLVRNKGKRSSIEAAIQLLLNSQHLNKEYLLLVTNQPSYHLELYLPTQTKNVRLLEELFDYILPVGYTYTIKLQDVTTTGYAERLTVFDQASHYLATDEELARLNYIDQLNALVVDSEGNSLIDSEGRPLTDSEGRSIASDRDMRATPSVNIEKVSPYVKIDSEGNALVDSEGNPIVE